ncbi:MAG: geranylgeranylglycerol-phosphate geranylgeranyltransferase, partial [Candidatus Aenigmarchaeota archaeon]|nr:geranylgeranylglycerol-phosphate geranylgeranyltransferase [Candidatus Aenigmarchaeota archaeon]
GNVINDYFDVGVDRINRPERPIPSGKISKKSAYNIAVALFLAGLGLGMLLNAYAAIIVIVNTFLVFIYSKVKEKTPYGSVFVGYFVASAVLFGAVVADINSVNVVGVLAVLAFLSNMAREITKDIEDVRGDKYRKTTLATYYNDRVAGAVAAVLLFIAICISVIPMAHMNSAYIYIISVADTLFAYSAYRLLNKPHEHAAEMQKFEKAAMFIALVAFFAGVL